MLYSRPERLGLIEANPPEAPSSNNKGCMRPRGCGGGGRGEARHSRCWTRPVRGAIGQRMVFGKFVDGVLREVRAMEDGCS